jgi:hypothetical protein
MSPARDEGRRRERARSTKGRGDEGFIWRAVVDMAVTTQTQKQSHFSRISRRASDKVASQRRGTALEREPPGAEVEGGDNMFSFSTDGVRLACRNRLGSQPSIYDPCLWKSRGWWRSGQ